MGKVGFSYIFVMKQLIETPPSPTDALFTAALGLMHPWTCTHTKFSKGLSRLDIFIDFAEGSRFSCSECHRKNLPIHDTRGKEWRHLDFFQHVCYLHARVPRVVCPEHGTHLVHVPWARQRTGFTLLFEALALAYAREMAILPASKLLGIHDTRLWRIVEHYVQDARSRVEYHTVTAVAVDETSSKRGHHYVTVVADPVEKSVLYATKGKDKAAFERFTQDFHDHNGNTDAIDEICMDMSPAYVEAAKECLPNARITFDKFHVMKMANDALDELRREEVRTDPQLKGTKYLFLRRPENLKVNQASELDAVLQANNRMSRGYNLVLDLRTFYSLVEHDQEGYLKRWCAWASRSRLEPFKNLAKTIKNHWSGILNYHKSGMTSGFMEGLNGIIQTAKRKAKGFRNTDRFILIIYLIAGKLPINVAHSF